MRRVTAALDHWPPEAPVIVRCSTALSERVRALAASRAGASVVADATVAAGAIIAGADGAAEVDGTLEGLLASREQALAIEIVRMAGEPEEVAP
jgi:vacuolar-type H+-ATPase subunit E/Vma4